MSALPAYPAFTAAGLARLDAALRAPVKRGPVKLEQIITELRGLTDDIRTGIDALDRSGRFGEHVTVTVSFRDRDDVHFSCFAQHGYNALADRLQRDYRRQNRRVITRCWKAPAHRRGREYVQAQMAGLVTFVYVRLRSHPVGTSRTVYHHPSWIRRDPEGNRSTLA